MSQSLKVIKAGISACLGYCHCRYDGNGFDDFDIEQAKRFLKQHLNVNDIEFYPLCPEQLGGLPTPRTPAEIVQGDGRDVINSKARVITKNNVDCTKNFLHGAHQTLVLAQKLNLQAFLLKDNSPSCGVNNIYTGEFNGTKKPGKGVTTALLELNGIKVFTVF